MSDIFISYARKDRERAEALARALGETSWSVFWDRTIPPGLTWRSYIGAALQEARCIVVGWSEASVASEWVLEEADVGKRKGILIPVFFEGVEPPLGFTAFQALDLSEWDGTPQASALHALVAGLERLLGPSQGDEEEGTRSRAGETEHERTEAGAKAEEAASEARVRDVGKRFVRGVAGAFAEPGQHEAPEIPEDGPRDGGRPRKRWLAGRRHLLATLLAAFVAILVLYFVLVRSSEPPISEGEQRSQQTRVAAVQKAGIVLRPSDLALVVGKREAGARDSAPLFFNTNCDFTNNSEGSLQIRHLEAHVTKPDGSNLDFSSNLFFETSAGGREHRQLDHSRGIELSPGRPDGSVFSFEGPPSIRKTSGPRETMSSNCWVGQTGIQATKKPT